jgi:hypothetical protein
MADAIHAVWTSAEVRADLRRQGLVQVRRFSWTRAAAETVALYDELLS